MSDNHLCPFCNATSPSTGDTFYSKAISFNNANPIHSAFNAGTDIATANQFKDTVEVNIFKCPGCKNHSIWIEGLGSEVKGTILKFRPISSALQFPDYIPITVREDYNEACAIVNLSPKASATLSRRSLQGMIRDYWNIENQFTLQNEIDAIKDKVDPQVRSVLHSLRQLGNIGAHPEKDINTIIDIEPGEAERMIKFIEYLMNEWYIKRHETEMLLNEINDINKNKKELKKSTSSKIK